MSMFDTEGGNEGGFFGADFGTGLGGSEQGRTTQTAVTVETPSPQYAERVAADEIAAVQVVTPGTELTAKPQGEGNMPAIRRNGRGRREQRRRGGVKEGSARGFFGKKEGDKVSFDVQTAEGEYGPPTEYQAGTPGVEAKKPRSRRIVLSVVGAVAVTTVAGGFLVNHKRGLAQAEVWGPESKDRAVLAMLHTPEVEESQEQVTASPEILVLPADIAIYHTGAKIEDGLLGFFPGNAADQLGNDDEKIVITKPVTTIGEDGKPWIRFTMAGEGDNKSIASLSEDLLAVPLDGLMDKPGVGSCSLPAGSGNKPEVVSVDANNMLVGKGDNPVSGAVVVSKEAFDSLTTNGAFDC